MQNPQCKLMTAAFDWQMAVHTRTQFLIILIISQHLDGMTWEGPIAIRRLFHSSLHNSFSQILRSWNDSSPLEKLLCLHYGSPGEVKSLITHKANRHLGVTVSPYIRWPWTELELPIAYFHGNPLFQQEEMYTIGISSKQGKIKWLVSSWGQD